MRWSNIEIFTYGDYLKYKYIFKNSKISQLVIPIVLYTGKKKWNAKRYLEESQETLDSVEIKAGNYNLVDINDFTKEELLQEKTLISKMMLLEKSESTEESIEMLEKIIPNTNKEEKELLKRVISILFGEKIGEEKKIINRKNRWRWRKNVSISRYDKKREPNVCKYRKKRGEKRKMLRNSQKSFKNQYANITNMWSN